MGSINKIILVGRCKDKPEKRVTNTGIEVCTLDLCTSEKRKSKDTGQTEEESQWHKIVLWDKLAQLADQYIEKGSMIGIDGQIRYKSWKDKDGNWKNRTEIQAFSLSFLGSPQKQMSRKEELEDQHRKNNQYLEDDIPF